jgi:hypothetical protein
MAAARAGRAMDLAEVGVEKAREWLAQAGYSGQLRRVVGSMLSHDPEDRATSAIVCRELSKPRPAQLIKVRGL